MQFVRGEMDVNAAKCAGWVVSSSFAGRKGQVSACQRRRRQHFPCMPLTLLYVSKLQQGRNMQQETHAGNMSKAAAPAAAPALRSDPSQHPVSAGAPVGPNMRCCCCCNCHAHCDHAMPASLLYGQTGPAPGCSRQAGG